MLGKIATDYTVDYELTFANRGDQNNQSIPETEVCAKLGINLMMV